LVIPVWRAAREGSRKHRSTDDRLEGLLEAAPDAIIAVDVSGHIVLANAQTQRLFGYEREELIGADIALLVPQGAGSLRPKRRARYAIGMPPGAETQLVGRRRDGTEFPAEINLSAVGEGEDMLVAAAIRDATERQRAEARFRSLLEAAPDAIVGVGADGNIALVNAQTERLFGYNRREMLGRPVEMLVPQSARALHPTHRSGYFAAPTPRPMGAGMELAGRRKDGTEFPAEISLSSIETDEGQLVSAAVRDVSDRRRAADTHAQLVSIVQSSNDAIIGKTLEGVVTSWNPGAERLYGYSAEEMIGEGVERLVPTDRRAEEAEMLRRIGLGARIEPYTSQRVRKDGVVIPVALSISPIADARGAIVGVASAARDIGERERAEAMVRGLLEAAPDAIVCVASNGRIALANAQAERLFGYTREELLGERVELLVPEGARGMHPGHRSMYFSDPSPRPMGAGMQLAGRRKDGTEFPAEISLSSIETDDGLLVSAAVRDVTDRLEAQAERERLTAQAERERMERKLHQSQRLESLGQLAGGVAHDFNNLLGVILNYSAFVADEVQRLARAEESERWTTVQSDIEQIRAAATRATRLTHQLLAFGRREVVQPRVLDLGEVVHEIEKLLRRTLGEHVELVTHVDDSLWPVFADPGHVEQVLVNLAVNARDAMRTGGRLTIEVGNLAADASYVDARSGVDAGDYVRLRVTDTGEGMEEAVLRHVFEPFFSTKPKGEGSGLGLATVYGIIAQAGGHVDIYSEPGRGTVVTALFPVTDIAAAPRETSASGERKGGGETVLVVEDEDAIREVTRRILTRHGYEVIVARSGPAALRLLDDYDGEIDLLLTDVVMPHMLGKEVVERVRGRRPEVGVLYMSGYAQPVLASEGTLDPGVTLVEKPFTEAALLGKVREVLDQAPAVG
jgi:PAS domain S-box-containing protein